MRAMVILLFALSGSDVGSSPVHMLPVTRDQLCITNGIISTTGHGTLLIDAPEVRAVVASGPARTVEARLRYLGRTKQIKRLASGELRGQFGFKLRAANTCNVVYVMWHIEPTAKLAVSIKSNPGMTANAQCDAHGYRNLTSSLQSPIPVLRPGEWHRLQASLAGETLSISLDGNAVWLGSIGADGMAFDGPVGIRSDNGRFELELFQSAPEHGAFHPGNPCHSQPESE
jgi:hypothetical protein